VRPRLDVLGLSDRLEVRSVEAAGWYMVYVPPFKTRAEADRAAEQLRDLGVREFLVIGDNSPMRFGIALGSFRDQDLANRHLADLQKRGVKAARVADKASTVTATRYVIRPVDPVLAAALQELQREFNAGRLVVCGEAS
jgi:cell division protein FtsN